MAKTALRRHYAERLCQKWRNLLRNLDPDRDLNCITFGKVYSIDPMDCGNPKCSLCSFGKMHLRKVRRAEGRKEERLALGDLD